MVERLNEGGASIINAARRIIHGAVEMNKPETRTFPRRRFIEQLTTGAALAPAGYFRSPDKRAAMAANLRAILSRAGFTSAEVRALRGVVAALEGRRRRGDEP